MDEIKRPLPVPIRLKTLFFKRACHARFGQYSPPLINVLPRCTEHLDVGIVPQVPDLPFQLVRKENVVGIQARDPVAAGLAEAPVTGPRHTPVLLG